ncbi:Spo0E family sporulation regulatory protein-aspartic acid phosphatase [Pelosinus baikalensis]|uniref:Aspartyl-phosphate phosphatase Spo0E family protein n=1 Tax=Pelosinus baikalensis TaxID=2892015 RepID=A0ABS8HYH2_9FIRM|nr:aspartyl-phosphate phosphatase Spo0E family protein [Pelosinus baikalensis]
MNHKNVIKISQMLDKQIVQFYKFK